MKRLQTLFCYLPLTLFSLVVALVPLVVKSNYYLSVLIFIGIHAIMVMGLCLLMGYAGQVSLGHAAFYGLGAYISAILTTTYQVPPWAALALAALFTAVVAYLIGIPILRLTGNFLAMATLGFGIIVYMVLINWVELTGGPSGLSAIPPLSLAGLTFDKDYKFYYLVWTAVFAILSLSLNVVNSRVGRALRSIHGSEIAANTVGVNTARYKVKVFTMSAVYASLAGSLYAHYLTFVNPSPFGFKFSVELVVMAVVGGLASLWGAILGAGTITVLTEFLRATMPKFLGHASGEYEIVVFGVILMVVMISVPGGLAAGLERLTRRYFRLSHSG
ncbi:MAG: branched-chain amino acid ABC transporter permease [candidate division NC10 bacterium]|nr:branched-chain amino acid ABC transporter permease [candidate division NC10 bacterium]